MNASGNPALILNADFRPLSYYPLSLCSWQDAVKSVFLNRVSVIEKYDQSVSSPTISFKLPSVIALKDYYKATEYLNINKCNFESHVLDKDAHNISPEAITLLQKFIKKIL